MVLFANAIGQFMRGITALTHRFKHCAINTDEKRKPMTLTGRGARVQHNDTTQETTAFF